MFEDSRAFLLPKSNPLRWALIWKRGTGKAKARRETGGLKTAAKAHITSLRTSDRSHWCGVRPAGAIRIPRKAHVFFDFLPENGFPRQCEHWLGMTFCLRFTHGKPAGKPAGFPKPAKPCGAGDFSKSFFLLNQQKFLTIFVNYANILKCVGVGEAVRETSQKALAFPAFSVLYAQSRD